MYQLCNLHKTRNGLETLAWVLLLSTKFFAFIDLNWYQNLPFNCLALTYIPFLTILQPNYQLGCEMNTWQSYQTTRGFFFKAGLLSHVFTNLFRSPGRWIGANNFCNFSVYVHSPMIFSNRYRPLESSWEQD